MRKPLFSVPFLILGILSLSAHLSHAGDTRSAPGLTQKSPFNQPVKRAPALDAIIKNKKSPFNQPVEQSKLGDTAISNTVVSESRKWVAETACELLNLSTKSHKQVRAWIKPFGIGDSLVESSVDKYRYFGLDSPVRCAVTLDNNPSNVFFVTSQLDITFEQITQYLGNDALAISNQESPATYIMSRVTYPHSGEPVLTPWVEADIPHGYQPPAHLCTIATEGGLKYIAVPAMSAPLADQMEAVASCVLAAAGF